MRRLTPEDFHLHDPIPYSLRPARKARSPSRGARGGRRGHDRSAFLDDDAFGVWSTPSANEAIRTAARKANLEPLTVYRSATPSRRGCATPRPDLADTQDLYGHTDPTTTRIYAAPTLAKHRDAIRRLRVLAEA